MPCSGSTNELVGALAESWEGEPDGTRRGVAIVASRFNGEITSQLLTSALGSRRQVQLMLGLPEGTSDSAIVRHLREAFKKPIPPRVVDIGPVGADNRPGADSRSP